MKTKDLLLRRKAELLAPLTPEARAELDAIYRALVAIEGIPHVESKERFRKKTPIKAMRTVLEEKGDFMPWDDLEAELCAGGILHGKGERRDALTDLRVSKKMSLASGSLIEDEHGNIGLPEWKDRLRKGNDGTNKK